MAFRCAALCPSGKKLPYRPDEGFSKGILSSLQSPDSLLARRECERNAATNQSREMSYDHNVINPRSFGASLRC